MYQGGVFMMGKKARFNSNLTLTKCGKRKHFRQDWISQLPEEIIISLVSHLSIKEAVATSILSNRWVDLWKFTSYLDFDASEILVAIEAKAHEDIYFSFKEMEMVKYVKWVNKVLQSHKGSVINGFRIVSDLDNKFQQDVDAWLQFAFARRVQSLDVNLLMYGGMFGGVVGVDPCTFPSQLLPVSRGSPLGEHNSNLGIIHSLDALSDFKCLKDLSLKGLSVSNDVLQFFLFNCPCLERFVVHGSETLEEFEVSGQSLMLKHLEIADCFNLTSVKVCDINLVSLKLLSLEPTHKRLDNLPSVINISIGYISIMHDALTTFPSCFSQLEVLTLHMDDDVNMELHGYSVLPKLKRLVVVFSACGNQSLMGIASLIKVAPYLDEFALQIDWFDDSKPVRNKGKLRKIPSCRHQFLKKVMVAEYFGRMSDLEFAMFFVRNAVALEELMIDTRGQSYVDFPGLRPDGRKEDEEARNCAKRQLEGRVPPHVRLLIL